MREIQRDSGLVVVCREKPLVARKMVVKVGSNVTTNPDGSLNNNLIDSVVSQTSDLFKRGVKIALVVSGAVKHGRYLLHLSDQCQEIEDLQTQAARGNIYLQKAFVDGFDKRGIPSFPQVFSEADLASPQIAHLLNRLMENGIPTINANDSVNDSELRRFLKSADNDKLSGFVATSVNADTLALLTDRRGILDVNGALIEDGLAITPGENVVFLGGNGTGPGGMGVKYGVCKREARKGSRGIIASALRDEIIIDIAERFRPDNCTVFLPMNRKV